MIKIETAKQTKKIYIICEYGKCLKKGENEISLYTNRLNGKIDITKIVLCDRHIKELYDCLKKLYRKDNGGAR